MSRCFPFPPPGYEKKIKADDLDLLKKEKHKDKKQKKDKKDKEKKESRDKREKERSDEKHKEKRDKKDKHRDKKKDKERDRDSDRHKSERSLPDDKKAGEPPEVHVYNPPEKKKDRENDRSVSSAEKRVAGLSAFNSQDSFSKNNHLSSESKNNCAPEMGRKRSDEERKTSVQLPGNIVAAERKKGEGVLKSAGKGGAAILDGKEKPKERPSLDGRLDPHGVTGETRSSGNVLAQNLVGVVKLPGKSAGSLVDGRERKEKPAIDGRMDGRAVSVQARSIGSALPQSSVGSVQNRVGAMPRPVDKKFEQKVEGKEKIREKDVDDRKGEKRKEKDKERAFPKDREKEANQDEKVKAISEQKHVQMTRVRVGSENQMLSPGTKDRDKKDFSGFQSSGIQNIPKNNNHGGATLSNNLGKRKNIGLNGTYDECVTGPNKLARTAASPHQLTENGKSLGACQNALAFAPGVQCPPVNIKVERTFAPDDTQRPPTNIKVDGKERKMNGINAEPFMRSPQKVAKAERKPDVPPKAPHPDSKYLSRVLSVPKMDAWPEIDDQEWLFSSSSSSFQAREPDVKPSGVDETPQVWARALWLEPVDVIALPYVVPH